MVTEGKNIWRKDLAEKISFVVDAAEYYHHLIEAFRKAEDYICILAWDIGSKVELCKEHEPGKNLTLSKLIYQLVEEKPKLRVYILCWNFPLSYIPTKQELLSFSPSWPAHDRVMIRYDNTHPVGACHHQKVVIVDGKLGFSGGLDICQRRWDTPEHIAKDPRRVDFNGKPYPPFHDIQAMVEGPIVKHFCSLFAERWVRATDEKLQLECRIKDSYWPADFSPELKNKEVAISLTYPNFGGFSAQKEVENITIAALLSAQKSIYIENQFLTSKRVAAILRSLLRKEAGPDIIIILPLRAASLIEEIATAAIQNRIIRRLRKADHAKRLGIYHLVIPELKDHDMLVHSKLMIIDDDLIKIGSSNLNNRSMGLDTECDITLEANGDPEIKSAIKKFRQQLVCEHLGLQEEELCKNLESEKLLTFIEKCKGNPRCMADLKQKTPFYLKWLVAFERVFDPIEPLRREQIISYFLRDTKRRPNRATLFGTVSIALTLLGLAALWYFIPLTETRERAFRFASEQNIIILYFLLCSLALLPPILVVLTLYTILGPQDGFLISWACIVGISFVQYLIGMVLPTERVKILVQWGANSFGQRLARLRALPDILLRALPIAPLPVVNLVSGATRMSLLSFFLLSIFGTLPLVLTLFFLQLLVEEIAIHFGARIASLLLVLSAITFVILIASYPKGRNLVKRG